MSEVKIVEAVAVACGNGGKEKTPMAQVMEVVMKEVIQQAFEDGVGMDADEVKRRMQAARVEVRDAFKAAEQGE